MFSLDISACFSARSSCFFALSSRPFRFCACAPSTEKAGKVSKKSGKIRKVRKANGVEWV
eukprot:2613700-Pleurochrysis_carterae.AAC.1